MTSTTWRPGVAVALLLCAGCSAKVTRAPGEPGLADDDDGQEPVDPDRQAAIDDVVAQAGALDVAPEQGRAEVACAEPLCPAGGQEGDETCTYRRFTETARRDAFVALQPNSANLWPGDVVRGRDAQNGLLTPLGLPQAPVTFSLSLENLAGDPVGRMPSPSLSSFREERNRILAADLRGTAPAALDFEITDVHSESQLALSLEVGVSWPGAGDVVGAFDFAADAAQTRILVDFTQAYYTIDVDTPNRPADFFAPEVTPEDVAARVAAGDPPLYVQSITYGRRVLFSVQTSASSTSVHAALEAALSGGLGDALGAEAAVSMSAADRQVLEESTIRVFVFGGSGAEASALVDGVEGLLAYIRNGGDFSRESPGAPIAYKLAYLDNAVTELAFTTEYTERECTQNRIDLEAALLELTPVGGDDLGNFELFGALTVRVPTADSPVQSCASGGRVSDVWRLVEGQWLSIPDGASWQPGTPTPVDVEDVVVGDDAHLCLRVELWDEDEATGELSSDDSFGVAEQMVSLAPDSDWPGEHVLHTSGSGENAVDVRVSLGAR